jgi:hypothetical protein
MPKRKKNESPTRSTDVDDCPIWNASAGDLYWRGCLVLHLAAQAHTERAILDRLEELRWRFVAKNPLARDSVGDQTASRRNAICNLMRHQGDRPLIQFFSAPDGFIAWCPAEWLTE